MATSSHPHPTPASPLLVPLPAPDSQELDSDSSAFLLLSQDQIASPSRPVSIPRPRAVPVLVLAALLDFGTTLAYLHSAWPAHAVGGLFFWGIARPLVIVSVATSKRIRERGWVVLAQVAVTFLVVLYHTNELVQARPAAAFYVGPGLPSRIRHLSQVAQYILFSLFFSLLHYTLFAMFVGIRRRQNPFVGRPRGVWGEATWQGREEYVRLPQDGPSSTLDTLASSSAQPLSEEEEDEDGRDEDDILSDASDDNLDDELASSSDEDEIIDIPRTGTVGAEQLRSRGSRLSLAVSDEGPLEEDQLRARGRRASNLPPPNGDLRNASRYGSIHSLAGI